MWCTAERRFVGHVCFRNRFPPFLFGIPSVHSLPEAWGPWERQHALPALHYCIVPISSLQLQKKDMSHAEKQRVWSRSCGHKTCYKTLIVLPRDYCRGAASLSAAHVRKMWRTTERRFVGHVRNPFLPFLLGIPSIHSLPEAWGSWEPQYTPPALHYCIMPIPLLQEKPVSCREAEGLVTELLSPRFVTMQWLFSQLCYVTAANRWTIVEIELLAIVGWKWGCQPFSCPRSQNVTHCRNKICRACKETNPAIPFGNSKHPLPTRSLRFLRATVRSTSSALCL